jgi:beta-lactamase regulating signal transducer with metallopeptidase domain/protocatechuate 3,4-dioxygenase beta subunit
MTDSHATASEGSHATASADARLPGKLPSALPRRTDVKDTAGLDEELQEFIAESSPPGHIPGTARADAPVPPERSSFAVGEASPVGQQSKPLAWWQVVGSLAAWLWAVGAALGLLRLGWGCVALARFCRGLVPHADPRQRLLVHEAADAVGLRRLPVVYVSRLAGVPMSIGLFRPAIVLPESMPRKHDQQQLQAVLLHEVAHIARRDHWVGVGQRIAGALFWWNPLVHWVCDQVSELREEICDNHVIMIQGGGQRLAGVLADLAAQAAIVPLLPSTVGVLEPRLAGLTGRVTRLLNKERNMEIRMNLRLRVLLLTCGVVALTGMAMVGGLRVADAQSVAEPSTAAGEEANLSTATRADGGHFDFHGQVLDPDGKPLAGANVYFVFYTNFTHPKLPPPPVRATTGPDGTFHFTVEQSEFDAWRAAHPWGILDDVSFRNDSRIVVQAPGYGPVWQPAFLFDQTGELRQRMLQAYPEDAAAISEEQKPVLRLVKDDVPLVGRVLDTDGKPITGVKISVVGIQPVKNEDLTGWLSTAEGKDADLVKLMKYTSVKRVAAGGSFADGALSAEVLPQIMPDADGRVCLTGIGRERLATLRIEGPGIESACMVHARTRPGPPIEIPYQIAWGPERVTYYGATFEHVARASVPIAGTVRDKESGKPLAGVTIQAHKLADNPARSFVVAYYFRTTSDAEGHYRLTGLPMGKGSELLAIPPQGQPYLMSKKTVDVTVESDPVQADFELKRGVLIRGRVTDAKTGAPVPDCTVDYYVFHNNPYYKEAPGFDGASQVVGPYMTDREGRYAVPGLPGRGVVAVQVCSKRPTGYPLRAGVEKIPELSKAGGRYDKVAPAPLYLQSKNAVAEVDPPEGAETFELDFQLDPGQMLSGTVLDPEGKPLSRAHYRGATDPGSWTLLDSARFSVNGYRPDKPRTLVFVQLDGKLSGSVVLKGEQTGTLTVQLHPWASVTGRLVDGDGKPLAGVELQDSHLPTNLWVKGSNGEFSRINESFLTDTDGRFCIEGLAPGLEYTPRAFDKRVGKYLSMAAFQVALEPGEAKDLGDVKIAPPVRAAVNASTWRITLELDAPNLEPPVAQYAILDKDPVPGFRDRVARQRTFHQRQLELHAGDPVRMQTIRTAGMTVNWDLGFRDVTGADLHLLASSQFGGHSAMSNAPEGKKWIVTKTVQIGGRPTCWCIPVEVKKGQEVAVTLSESNTFDLEGTFQSAMEERAE